MSFVGVLVCLFVCAVAVSGILCWKKETKFFNECTGKDEDKYCVREIFLDAAHYRPTADSDFYWWGCVTNKECEGLISTGGCTIVDRWSAGSARKVQRCCCQGDKCNSEKYWTNLTSTTTTTTTTTQITKATTTPTTRKVTKAPTTTRKTTTTPSTTNKVTTKLTTRRQPKKARIIEKKMTTTTSTSSRTMSTSSERNENAVEEQDAMGQPNDGMSKAPQIVIVFIVAYSIYVL